MKMVIVLAVVLAVALAAAQGNDKDAQILRYDSDNIGVDGYKYAFETSNGIAADETGQVINAGSENEGVAVRGSFSYIGPNGELYVLTYNADENGFQPEGAHLPKA